MIARVTNSYYWLVIISYDSYYHYYLTITMIKEPLPGHPVPSRGAQARASGTRAPAEPRATHPGPRTKTSCERPRVPPGPERQGLDGSAGAGE